jgi:hypothetical protein
MSVVAPPRWVVVYAEAHAERFRYLGGCGGASAYFTRTTVLLLTLP